MSRIRLFLLLLLSVAAAGCELVGGIFKAGMWVGALAVILVLVVIVWMVGKARG